MPTTTLYFPRSPGQRRGLNCVLSYSDGNVRTYRVRVDSLTWGFTQIADESQARRTRAFYPHQTAPTQFAITLSVVGQAERTSLSAYFMRYADYILDPGFIGRKTPQMTVKIPSRNFVRIGTPIDGIEFGTRVGAMVYTPTVVFETSGEPIDWNDKYFVSAVRSDLAYYKSPDSQYFYPTGTQLSGGEAPAAQSPLDPVQAAINGTTDPVSPPGGHVEDGVV